MEGGVGKFCIDKVGLKGCGKIRGSVREERGRLNKMKVKVEWVQLERTEL